MKHPLVLFAAAVLSGILYGLPEVPIIWKAASVIFTAAMVCFAKRKSRGNKNPLFFLLTGFSICLFLIGLFRASRVAIGFEETRSFFEKYEATNPGQFDYSLYLKSKGIDSEEKRLKEKDSLNSFQQKTASVMETHVSPVDAGVFRSVLAGDKSELDEETESLYQKNGISHLLAVSGLHVQMAGLIAGFLSERIFHLNRKMTYFVTVLFVFAYSLFTGAGASSLRAAFMFIAARSAPMIGRSYDATSALCLSAVLLLVKSPYLIIQSGFQLSFTAMLGIIIAGKLNRSDRKKESAENRIMQIKQQIKEALVSSLCVTITTLPVIASAYYEIPVLSFLLNLIVIPLMTVLMCSAFGVLFAGSCETFSFVSGSLKKCIRFLSVASAAPGHYVLSLYALLCSKMQCLSFSRAVLGKPSAVKIIVFYLTFFLLIFLFLKLRKKCRTLIVLLFVYVISLVFLKQKESESMYITVLDVGQGDCFHIHSGKTDIVIDCGSSGYEKAGSRILKPYLLSKGITTLDTVIISHADADHTNGILYLLQEEDSISVDRLLLPNLALKDEKYNTLTEAALKTETEIGYMKAGTELDDGALNLKCVYVETNESVKADTNRESAVLLLDYPGLKMLFTGDITEKEEQEMVCLYADSDLFTSVDLIKCSHHGSDTANTEAFLKLVDPAFAVLSYGEGNRYGHPSDSVVSRLEELGIEVLSTARNGAIRIEPGDKEVRISAY